jgi:hypothetical protein
MGSKLPYMTLTVGSTVTRLDKAPSEHGVVTAVGNDTVTVDWHLNQVEGRGRAGDSMGKVYELPAMLIPDTPCPYCKVS